MRGKTPAAPRWRMSSIRLRYENDPARKESEGAVPDLTLGARGVQSPKAEAARYPAGRLPPFTQRSS